MTSCCLDQCTRMFARKSFQHAFTSSTTLTGTRRTIRNFSSTRITMSSKLRIGFVPEHFSTPIAFAQQHFSLDADLIPFPTGTGALASALKTADRKEEGSIDVAIGLTEGFVADLGRAKSAGTNVKYGLVGTYVESPLCWAISTGADREDIQDASGLKGKKVGVSRIGSGSYVMSYVLADQKAWLSSQAKEEPFGVVPIGDFKALRKSVGADRSSDFFMWEHFTTKHYWDNGELKRIGEIYTPWPSWMIAARSGEGMEMQVQDMLDKLNDGVQHYRENKEEALAFITSEMEYSREDALEWMTTVKFAEDVRGVRPSTIDATAAVLKKAGVLEGSAGGSEHMVHIQRAESQPVSNPAEV